MRKNHLYLIKALALVLLISGCRTDDILYTDEEIDSGGGNSGTELVDPSLKWSASECTAYLSTDSNSYPTLTNEYGVDVTYTSSNSGVATISSGGIITLVAEGSTTITATSEANANYKAASVSYLLTVKSSADDGAVTTVFASSGDSSSDDNISNTTFTRLVTVTYSGSSAAVLAARRALFRTSWMFEARESPPVMSFILARRKGVVSLP